MKKLNCTKLLLLYFIIPLLVAGQEKLILTLEECISIGQQESPSAKVTENKFKSSQLDYQAFKAGLLPQLIMTTITPQLDRSIRPFPLEDGSTKFVTRKEALSSMSLSIKQEIPWTGGQFTISSGLQRIDIFGEEDSYTWHSSPLSLEFRQPIFKFNSLNWERKLRSVQNQVEQSHYLEDREQIALDVSRYFFNFYLAGINLENAIANYTVNDTIYYISKGRYNVGKIAENEILQSELKLMEAKAQVSRAELQYKQDEENLRVHLNLPSDMELVLLPPHRIVTFEIDPDEAVEQAKNNRSDPLTFKYRKLEAQRRVDLARSNAGITGDLIANYGYYKSSEKISELYQEPLENQFLQLGFEIPIFTWGKGAAEIDAESAYQEAEKNSVALNEQEFYTSVYFQALNVKQLMEQVMLAAKSDTIADRRFTVSKNRYLIGKIDITNMFIAQSEKDNARKEFIVRLSEYWMAYYRLRLLTLYDFENNQPLKMVSQ